MLITQDNISKSYTVSYSDTWEKTLTCDGDTGAVDNNNG